MAIHNIRGSKAELAVAEYLKKSGYKIIDTNWKTKYCEIDIIAQKNDTLHFVEVKYRKSLKQGGGLEYLTKGKLNKMQRAASYWVNISKYEGQYVLSAAEVSGNDYKINFIECI